MKLRTLMMVSAALACPYGILCVVVPETWMHLWGIIVVDHGVLVARMYGGQVFGFGFLSFLAARTPGGPAKHAIVVSFAVVDFLSFSIALYAVVTETVGLMGLVDVVAFFAFATGFGWFAVKERDA